MEQTTQHIATFKKQNRTFVLYCVFALALFITFSFHLQTFKRKHINSDVVEYYSFVTAVFECNDLSFTSSCPKHYWAQKTKDGRHVNKRSIGMAYMYLPFYAVGQGVAYIQGRGDDGYSSTTQFILVIGCWIYVCIGLYFLGKALVRFFPMHIALITLTLVLAATNLTWYTNGEPLFTHGVNFMWLSMLIYFTIRYHQLIKLFDILCMAICISMLALIRPNNILLALFPFLYGIYNRKTLLDKWRLAKDRYDHLLLALAVFLIPIIPQLIYWKYATGNWIYYSYQGEKFYWDRPMILEVLFSFRKGWLLYTPVMIMSLLGIFSLRKKVKEFFIPVIVILPVFVYVISCWWAWSYGGCYGMRPMIDIYALLVFPMAAFIWNKKRYQAWLTGVFMMGTVGLNIFQVWQYSKVILHYDQMNQQTYMAIWGKTRYPENYDLLISYLDYSKELKGEGSFYTPKDLTEGCFTVEFLRAHFVSSSDTVSTLLNAVPEQVTPHETFQFIYNFASRGYYIRSVKTGLFCTHDYSTSFIYANQKDILRATSFEVCFLGNNKFAMKVPNGNYITSSEGNQYSLKADAVELNPAAYIVLRKFIPY